MHRTRYRGWFLLLLVAIATGALGCSHKTSDWVTQTDTEAVKPRQGITARVVELDNCKGLDWKNDDELYVYRYSNTVFGDDRGVATVAVTDEKPKFVFQNFEKRVDDVRRSPSGQMLVYDLAYTGTKNSFLAIRQLETGQDRVYQMPNVVSLEGLFWNRDGSAYSVGVGDAETAWKLQTDGTAVVERFKTPKPLDEMKEGHVNKNAPSMPVLTSVQEGQLATYVLFSGPEWNRIARYDRQTGTSLWLPFKNVESVKLNSTRESLAVLEFSKDYSQKTLVLCDSSGRPISSPVQNEHLLSYEWSRDGNQMLYAILNKDNNTELFVADLKTGTRSFVATYSGYGPNRMAFSPSGKKIMISFGKALNDPSKIPSTQILVLK